MQKAWPNARLIHLPVHASWLDQAETYTLSDFTDLDALLDRIDAHEAQQSLKPAA